MREERMQTFVIQLRFLGSMSLKKILRIGLPESINATLILYLVPKNSGEVNQFFLEHQARILYKFVTLMCENHHLSGPLAKPLAVAYGPAPGKM